MKKIKTVISILWFTLMSLSSPIWIGCIYMDLTGHGKGYGYDLGSEADIYVFLGCVFLLIWLLAIVPVTISLCKKGYHKKKSFVWLPLLAFVGLFVVGICIIRWNEFIKFFGYGYPPSEYHTGRMTFPMVCDANLYKKTVLAEIHYCINNCFK